MICYNAIVKIIGIDEVGRGCWAGPVVAGAVLLTGHVEGLADSKSLTASQRVRLASKIRKHANIGLGWVSAFEVDTLGLTEAVRLAMSRALKNLNCAADKIIIDGNYNFLSDIQHTHTLIKADRLIPEVSAASIIAKVARDRYMHELALQLPGYGFEKHVGYGTLQHKTALYKQGVTHEHRKSYKPIKALLQYS